MDKVRILEKAAQELTVDGYKELDIRKIRKAKRMTQTRREQYWRASPATTLLRSKQGATTPPPSKL